MSLTLIAPPAIEPVTLTELKDHLRIDSGGIGDALSIQQTILPGSHAIAPGYTLVGATIDVLGYTVLAVLAAGTFGAGTVNTKLQESSDGIAWTDVTSGAFPAVTNANDEAAYELAYTGTVRYLRAVSTVAGAASEFGVHFILRAPVSIEDALLSGFITAARQYCEGFQNRAYITQTWELGLDEWPETEIFEVPLPPMQSAGAKIEYYDTAGVVHLVAAATYQIDIRGYKGRIAPVYGESWPTTTLRSLSGIVVTFKAGYGDLASAVPERIKAAIKLLAGHMYEHREATDIKEIKEVPFAVKALLGLDAVGIV